MTSRMPMVLAIAGLLGLLSACGTGEDGENATAPIDASTVVSDEPEDGSDAPVVTEAPPADDEAASDTEAPPETEAPPDTEAPPETEAPPDTQADDGAGQDGDDEDGEGNGGNANLLVIVAVVLLVLAGLPLLLRGRSGSGRSTADPPRVPTAGVDLDHRVLGDISWFNEQLSLDVLSATPEDGRERWRNERPRIEALTRDCQRLEESTGDPIWGALAGEVATLAQSLDTATMSRAGLDADPLVVTQAIDQVNRHRSQLAGLAMQVRRG